jgi:hypothetical protein
VPLAPYITLYETGLQYGNQFRKNLAARVTE